MAADPELPNQSRPRDRGAVRPWQERLAWLRTGVNVVDLLARFYSPHDAAGTGTTSPGLGKLSELAVLALRMIVDLLHG
ncbi:hypothetical protein [Nocardia wallacei]|uniref:hypothetical protein n=1 Tax=Nocardia wallacei TaxID=480035 RepID=UPI0024579CEB|nr:hypothetical protein [Nocardia wallacei]